MLTTFEIQTQVKDIINELNNLVHGGTFTYQPKIEQLTTQLNIIRNGCPHSYKNGKCEYCQKEETNE
jgi:hypothetical protein